MAVNAIVRNSLQDNQSIPTLKSIHLDLKRGKIGVGAARKRALAYARNHLDKTPMKSFVNAVEEGLNETSLRRRIARGKR